jgi:TonB family protein
MRVWRVVLLVVMGCGLGAGQDAPPKAVRISGGVMAEQILSRVDPVYPAEAKAQGIQCSVVLRAVIDGNGTVQNLTVVAGNGMLAAAAVDAVRQWTYKPYLLNGEPTAVDTTVTVTFSLAPDGSEKIEAGVPRSAAGRCGSTAVHCKVVPGRVA